MSGPLPFSREDFFGVFSSYNDAVWPAQLLAYAIAGATLLALSRKRGIRPGAALVPVGLLWVWTGTAYHWSFFAAIDPIAGLFAMMFVLQGVLLLWEGIRGSGRFQPEPGWRRWVGYGLIVYAMLVYPLLGLMTGERYPAMPTFGITPCPLTLFTIGLLVVLGRSIPVRLLAIPVLWSLIGGTAALLLAVAADWMLFLAAALAILAAWQPHRGVIEREAD